MKTKNIIFGVHAIKSLLKCQHKNIKKILIAKELKITLLKKIKLFKYHLNIPILFVKKKQIDIKTNNYNHQGIMAEIQNKTNLSYKDFKNFFLKNLIEKTININLILIIENVTDPRNLGAALRIADAVGIKIVIISKYHTTPINNAIVQKTASGMTENIKIFQVSNLLRIIDLLKKHNFFIIGTSPKNNGNTNLFNNNFIFPMAILFGSEDNGLSNLILKNCDKIIFIPMFGKINSLNISVSIGVVLYEIIRKINFVKS